MISVIIPTLNEEVRIAVLLRQLEDIPCVHEILVVDGGSKDCTIELVKDFKKVKLIEGEKGRANQMNLGSEHAQNPYLFFLHADSNLSQELIQVLPDLIRPNIAGAFKITFDKDGLAYGLYSWFSQFNLSLFTYGDQGLLIDKSLFDAMGGFKNIPIMEDLDIVRRLKGKVGFSKFPQTITTSSRRFKANGVYYQQIVNILLVIGFYLQVKPQFLSRFYRY